MSNAACVWALWTTLSRSIYRRQPDRSAGARPRHCRKEKSCGCHPLPGQPRHLPGPAVSAAVRRAVHGSRRVDRQCAELGVTFKRRGILWRWAACKRPTCPRAACDAEHRRDPHGRRNAAQVPPLPCDRHGSAAFLGAAAAGSGRGPRDCTGSDPENRRADFVQLFQHCHLLGGGPPGERHFKDQREPARRLCRAAAAA